MPKVTRYILLAVVLITCSLITFSQYERQRVKHEWLSKVGIWVPLSAELKTSTGVEIVAYTFTTINGRVIRDSRKSGNGFKKYLNAKVIYNPADLNNYELSFDFENYNTTWLKIFFFLIYLPAMTFVIYKFCRLGYKLSKTLANHTSW